MDRPLKFIETFLEHLHLTLRQHVLSVKFIVKYKIWEGFWEYGWVARLLVIIGIILGLKLVSLYFSVLAGVWEIDLFYSVSAVSSVVWDSLAQNFLDGGYKYAVLILLEIVIFHVSRRTVSILTGVQEEPSFENFVKAQIRMIKVSFRAWITEAVLVSIIGAVLSDFEVFNLLESVLVFCLSCYFIGLGVVDNYNEQFGLSIKESFQFTKKYIGVAFGAGLVLQLFFLVPVAGTVIGPFLSSVAVALAMFKLTDLHIQALKAANGAID